MQLSIYCYAASSAGRRGWIWKTIRTCPLRKSLPPQPPTIWHSWEFVDGHPAGVVGSSSENAAIADILARVRQGGTAVCRRRRGLPALPSAIERVGAAGPRTARHR